jgi:hypothetical protein
VNNLDGYLTPAGREGNVWHYRWKSHPPSVGVSDNDTLGCCFPCWRHHRGVSTPFFFCSSTGLGDVSGQKPRSGVGSAWWRHPRYRHSVGSIVFGHKAWRFQAALLWCSSMFKANFQGRNAHHCWQFQDDAFLGPTKFPHLSLLIVRRQGKPFYRCCSLEASNVGRDMTFLSSFG